MAKPLRGRAGREDRKADQLETYGAELAHLMLRQIRPRPSEHVIHLGYPGAVELITGLAPRVLDGHITCLVYTFDELKTVQDAVSIWGHVTIVNELDEIDPAMRFDLATSIAAYQLGQDYVSAMITIALRRLKPSGTFIFAGDRRFEFERYETYLNGLASTVTTLATSAHNRVLQVEAAAIKRKGALVRR